MKLQTKVEISLNKNKINHQHKIAMIGSCFTQNIGEKLQQDQFDVSINPYGILFNPVSVAKAIKACLNQLSLKEEDLIKVGEQWASLNHHSQFNTLVAKDTLQRINQSIQDAKSYYAESNLLIITFGTAWVYELNETKEIVANCHKIPNKNFTKRLLTIEEIVDVYSTLFLELISENPNLNIMFTVSPVRHWKDGVVENNRSKSVLHLAIMELVNKFEIVSYFPSYEIVLDELRDYRFYKEDMLHPNQQAVDYIYERFSDTFYTKETVVLNKRIRKLKLALAHKPFNINSEAHQLFIKQTKEKVLVLEREHPYLNINTN